MIKRHGHAEGSCGLIQIQVEQSEGRKVKLGGATPTPERDLHRLARLIAASPALRFSCALFESVPHSELLLAMGKFRRPLHSLHRDYNAGREAVAANE